MKLLKHYKINNVTIKNKLVHMYNLFDDILMIAPVVHRVLGDIIYRIYYIIGDRL